ncbi:hypothetical protein GH714_007000 [Hevea brasiliensis]|uniref:Reverse transcriptase/retrotransposon-derived protein RNase H-like domain-containing protein n=1 Tax=Hevea brasiliensis TaxID=3981 RepID=A0A6A6MCM1_HEVBR|nr:hypothetical protein GH714_007000 [Hevea brasiliensis]
MDSPWHHFMLQLDEQQSYDRPGAICQDPRFIGGDGIMFYFHGKKDKDFCLVSDPQIHINAHFISKKSGKGRDFTWVQSTKVLFGSYQLYIGAQKVAKWEESIDNILIRVNEEHAMVLTGEGQIWWSLETGLVIQWQAEMNKVRVKVEGLFEIIAHMLPITMEESRVHGYHVEEDDCFAHLELNFKFHGLSKMVDGVLGQTYRLELDLGHSYGRWYAWTRIATGISFLMQEMEDRIEKKQTEFRKENESSTQQAIEELKSLMAGISLQYNELATSRGFVVTNTPMENRVKIAAMHLDGKAVQCHQGYVRVKGTEAYGRWDEYVQRMKARFGIQVFDDPLADLKNLKQTGTLQDYLDAFDALYHKVGIREDKALSFFLLGLVDELQMPPKSVAKASYTTASMSSFSPTSSVGSITRGNNAKDQTGILPLPSNASKLPMGISKLPNNLIGKQFNEKREKGLCFWCDEKFLPSHKCKKRYAFVMQIIIDEGEDGEKIEGIEVSEELQLSLSALKGTQGAQTMCIHGCSGKLQLQVLVETRSTHNFLRARVAKKLRCDVEPVSGISVEVANGQNMQCHAKCTSFKRQMQNHHFNAEVFILPLDNYDLILGAQWMETLGLTGYYRRFIKNYGQIARPLTDLLKKDSFSWTPQAHSAFDELKRAMIIALLALPSYDKVFVVETDASRGGIGAVLIQGSHPIAYISKALSPRNQQLSIYDREMLAILFAVKKWEAYLLPNHFIIQTDHQPLKYHLEQRLTTPTQQAWLAKLLQFDYELRYKKGKENIVADGLS